MEIQLLRWSVPVSIFVCANLGQTTKEAGELFFSLLALTLYTSHS